MREGATGADRTEGALGCVAACVSSGEEGVGRTRPAGNLGEGPGFPKEGGTFRRV